MSLNGVDISGWNKGIDVINLTADFVIVKATEGTQGTIYNENYRSMANDALSSGKLLGFYHYANGDDPIDEANSFYDAIKDYKGKAIPCLDWEGQGNDLFGSGDDVSWCRIFLERIAALMEATPMLYTSKGVCNQWDWSSCVKYPLWGAEYAYDDYVYQGYDNDPWQSNREWGAWGHNVTIHQYGYVHPRPNNGGVGALDADKFYGTRLDWEAMCGQKPKQKTTEPKNNNGIYYRAHCQTIGWCGTVRDGQTAGTEGYGKRLEAIKITPPEGVELTVTAHIQTLGDRTYKGITKGKSSGTNSSDNDPIIGTIGRGKRLEAITIKCSKNTTGLKLFYQGHIQGIGWGPVHKEGELCGTKGKAKRLEAIRIWFEKVPEQDPGQTKNTKGLKYSAHVQKLGWCPEVKDGQIAGTEGCALRMEALKINPPKNVEIEATAHIQSIGNKKYKLTNGNKIIIGTTGQSKRLEAITLKLTKNPDKVKLYYQGHIQGKGWTSVCKEGQLCGTTGQSKRLEAIKIWLSDK